MNAPLPLVGAIELGGTKVHVAVGRAPEDICANLLVPTTTPDSTLKTVIEFLRAQSGLTAIGIGSFGPVVLDSNAGNWGSIIATTKPGWSNTQVALIIANATGLPIAFDTDVNAAALGEHRWGALRNCKVGLYLTVGTGIGGGIVVDGLPLHGLVHPELGHILVKRAADDEFAGVCPFHGECLEGLASGPAIMARLGKTLSEVPVDDGGRAIVMDALGQGLANFVLTLSPNRIVIGGGVAKVDGFHAQAAKRMRHWLAGYVPAKSLEAENYVVSPTLGDWAGVAGCIALAHDLLINDGALKPWQARSAPSDY